MSQAPSMPMFWDAYIGDTTHLTTEEHGAYLLLLGAMWRRNGYVPNDDRDLARIVGLTSGRWSKTKARLASLLIIENDTITQKNLLKIWKITQEKIETNRENGKLGGRPKVNAANDLPKANGLVSHNPNDNRNLTIPETEPDTEKKEDTPKGVSKKPDMTFSILCHEATEPAVTSFMAYRKRKKLDMTETGAKRLAKHLRAIFDAGGDTDDALAMAEERGWRTVEPEWYFRERAGNGNGDHNTNGAGRNGNSAHDKLMAGFASVADREQRAAGLDREPSGNA